MLCDMSRRQAASRLSCLSVLVLVAIAACSPSDSVTRGDLSHDLQKFYVAHPLCVALAMSFPAEIQSLSDDPYGELVPVLESHGLVRRTISHEPSWLIQSTRYELTPQGKSYIHANEDRLVGGSKLCYAYRHIMTVDSYHEVSSGADHLLTVTYTFEMQPLNDWVLDPAISAAGVYFLIPAQSGPISSRDALQLVGDTWVITRSRSAL
jgi:hypothetical protein